MSTEPFYPAEGRGTIPEQEFLERLAAIRERVPADALTALREAHRDYWWCCSAHGEGMGCCFDLLTEGQELT